MKLLIFGYNKELNINFGDLSILNVNNPKLFRKIIEIFLDKDKYTETNEIVLLGEKRIKFNDFLFVDNLLSYTLDSKKIIGKLISNYLSYVNYDEEKYIELYSAIKVLLDDFEKYLCVEEVEHYYQDISFLPIFKAMNFEIENEYSSTVEKVESIVNINLKLNGINLYIFCGLHQICTLQDLCDIIDVVKKYNVAILLLENVDISKVVSTNYLQINEDFSAI